MKKDEVGLIRIKERLEHYRTHRSYDPPHLTPYPGEKTHKAPGKKPNATVGAPPLTEEFPPGYKLLNEMWSKMKAKNGAPKWEANWAAYEAGPVKLQVKSSKLPG